MPVNLNIGQSVIVGREGNIRITDASVSRRHCKITRVGDRSFNIDDLGSKNGTFVDGLNVFSSVATPESSIRLGKYETSLAKLGLINSVPVNPPGPKKPESTVTEVYIDELFTLYEQFDNSQRDIQKRRARMGMNRMMLYTIPGIVGTIGSFLRDKPEASLVCGIVSAAAVIGVAAYTMLMPGRSDQLVDEQAELNQNFQLNFTCPHCKNFLGQKTPKLLLKVGSCPYCKTGFRTRYGH